MSHPKDILLAEEDAQYALIIQLALKQAGIGDPVHLVTSGEEAIAYLAGTDKYADRRSYLTPAAIILALRLPLMDDFRPLRWIRRHHEFYHVGLVVLSGIEYDDERKIARQLGADCYHVKPDNFDALVAIARRIGQRWLTPADRQAAA